MYIDIDTEEERLYGFKYLDEAGMMIFISINKGYVTVANHIETKNIDIFNEDIPKLIKALQRAYQFKQSKG